MRHVGKGRSVCVSGGQRDVRESINEGARSVQDGVLVYI
jgi:hypothetical protein